MSDGCDVTSGLHDSSGHRQVGPTGLWHRSRSFVLELIREMESNSPPPVVSVYPYTGSWIARNSTTTDILPG